MNALTAAVSLNPADTTDADFDALLASIQAEMTVSQGLDDEALEQRVSRESRGSGQYTC